MNLENVQSEEESEESKRVIWPNVTTKGKLAIKKIQSAIANQTSELNFKKEVIEALVPVFNEVYLVVKYNVTGYDDFLDQFPILHDLKNPYWAQMFSKVAFNAANVQNADIKKQLTDMEIRLKAIGSNIPTTNEFIKVS